MPDLSHSLANFRAALDEIKRLYANEDDAEALRDTALGETDLEDAILRTLREALEREAMADGISALMVRLSSRMQRLDDGAERLRAACLHAMQEAGIDKLRAPDMSVSVGLAPAKVIIMDKSQLLSNYLRFPEPEPNKEAIAAALKRGETVPGAETGNRAPFLRISTR